MPAKTLAIIGGGAAGLAAAVAAGECARQLGEELSVEVLERDDRVGRSILATGNGRCNFSNDDLRLELYRNGRFVEDVLWSLALSCARFGDERYKAMLRDNGDDVHVFFYKHGLLWHTEAEGRQYPFTNRATTVLDVLRAAADAVGVRERCDSEVRSIDLPDGKGARFTLRMADGSLRRADAVIIACGGKGLASLGTAGMHVRPMEAVLGPLRVSDADTPFVRALDGVRVRCSVSLEREDCDGNLKTIAVEHGELMFRKYGVSGIAVFNLSRHAQPGDKLCIDLLNERNEQDAIAFLYKRRKLLSGLAGGRPTYETVLRGIVLPRVYEELLKRAGIAPGDSFGKEDVAGLAELLRSLRFTIAGIGDEAICQVRRGGIPVNAIDARTMGLAGTEGLYAAGEAVDVDGPCGGYNLHWAWASGILAGQSAVEIMFGKDDALRSFL